MAKIFQYGLFLNFILVGIALGYTDVKLGPKTVVRIFFIYWVIYLLIGSVVMSDVAFLVPTL